MIKEKPTRVEGCQLQGEVKYSAPYVWDVAFYGSATWTISVRDVVKLLAFKTNHVIEDA